MFETGATPFDKNGIAYDLSVEHIMDREIGGQNTEENFRLTSYSFNALRDIFKKTQLESAYGIEYQGGQYWYLGMFPEDLDNPILIMV